MASDTGSYSPDQLQTFQKVFDLIWMELREKGGVNFFGPLEPAVLREEIARRVISHSNGGEERSDDVTQSVLRSFGIGGITHWRG